MIQRVPYSICRNASLLRSKLHAPPVRAAIVQARQLHATWTILLNHFWMYHKEGLFSDGRYIIEETDLPCDKIPTVLFLHDSHADLEQCRPLAERLLLSAKERSGAKQPTIQCLLVDVRGSGRSDADDYEAPHSVQAATEDILNLVQSVCPAPYIAQPSAIVAYGRLGSALADCYLKTTAGNGGLTNASHSEISGAGAVVAPSTILLLSDKHSSHVDSHDSPFRFDADVCQQLHQAAIEYKQEQQAPPSITHAGREPVTIVQCNSEQDVLSRLLSLH